LAASFISDSVPAMKLLTEYLERAVNLERLAASEDDSKFKTELLNQATAYRKLATRRAEQFGLPATESARNCKARRLGLRFLRTSYAVPARTAITAGSRCSRGRSHPR